MFDFTFMDTKCGTVDYLNRVDGDKRILLM